MSGGSGTRARGGGWVLASEKRAARTLAFRGSVRPTASTLQLFGSAKQEAFTKVRQQGNAHSLKTAWTGLSLSPRRNAQMKLRRMPQTTITLFTNERKILGRQFLQTP